MLEGIVISKSKILLVSCFCFLLGIVIASVKNIHIDFVFLYGTAFFFIGMLALNWKQKKARIIFLFFLCIFLGISRYSLSFPSENGNHVFIYNNQKTSVVGFIDAEPDVRLDGVRYIVEVTEAEGAKAIGRIYVKSNLYPRYAYGDVLRITCRLKAPEPIEDFRYDMFLARYDVFSICAAPNITKVGQGQGSWFFDAIYSFKILVAKKINLLWHEPYASFMAGLLYGYRGGLGSLNELFAVTGVTHIIAISGYNITIIATILITVCTHLLIPRKKAFWLVTSGIVVFVIFAGASASVVRAGIMGIIVLFAKQVGRASSVGNVMVLTAVIMSIQNPFVLIWDAGFQLSFISTLGLVYLAPLFERPLKKMPEVLGIKESLVSTLAAIVATLPLILYQFGRLSIVAPFVNILILWILPWIMFVGFFAVVVSYLFVPVAHVISWIAFLGMKYIVIIVAWFAALPFAAVDMRVSFWIMVLLYGVIGVAIYFNKKRLSK
jgi:competence protein ComEC